jgi:hypothetical protein
LGGGTSGSKRNPWAQVLPGLLRPFSPADRCLQSPGIFEVDVQWDCGAGAGTVSVHSAYPSNPDRAAKANCAFL